MRQDAAATKQSMPQSPIALAESSRQRWQFSIRGMLIFTASVAVGASVSQIDLAQWLTIFAGYAGEWKNFRQPREVIKTGFGGAFLAVAVFWLCLGLVYQIRDILACLKENPAIDKPRRAGGQIEILWRTGVIALLAGYLLVLFLVNMRVLILPETGDHVWKMGTMLREAVLLVLLLIVVGSVPSARRFELPSFVRQISQGVFYALALYYLSKTCVYILVNIACLGFDAEASLKISSYDPRYFAQTLRIFFLWSLISAFAILLNLFFLKRMARDWSAGIGKRVLWSGLLLAGIVENAAYVVWTMAVGYPTISPYLATTGGPVMKHSWVALVVFAAVVSAVPAYRMSADRSTAANIIDISWRRHRHKYFHESRMVLLLLATTLLWILGDIYSEACHNPSFPLTEFGNMLSNSGRFRRFSYWDFGNELFFYGMPSLFLWLSLFLLTLQRVFSPRFDPRKPLVELPRIDRAKLSTVWLATLSFTFFGSLAVVWISFGLWYFPWIIKR